MTSDTKPRKHSAALYMPRSLHAELKAEAARRGRSLSGMLLEAVLKEYPDLLLRSTVKADLADGQGYLFGVLPDDAETEAAGEPQEAPGGAK